MVEPSVKKTNKGVFWKSEVLASQVPIGQSAVFCDLNTQGNNTRLYSLWQRRCREIAFPFTRKLNRSRMLQRAILHSCMVDTFEAAMAAANVGVKSAMGT